MNQIRILVTGSRSWRDKEAISNALSAELERHSIHVPAVLVHGACEFGGADTLAREIWNAWCVQHPTMFETPEAYPAKDFTDPKARNLHMISLGADACLAFAADWISGTGHCARAARRAGIRTYDFGVSTRIEDRPGAKAA